MQLLIGIKGHGRVDDAAVPYLKAKVEALQAAAADCGLDLRADFLATQPDAVAVAEPEPEPPPVLVPPSPVEPEPDPNPADETTEEE